ncbi:MAG: hypothetical protein NG740_03150 [Omnitrophica bacterium]|nr:hypothetical protein [Candidatus Omnitrophota bacterium]
MDVKKVIIFSTLIAANAIVWCEVLGMGFLWVMGIMFVVLVLILRKK